VHPFCFSPPEKVQAVAAGMTVANQQGGSMPRALA
jgi:hypothetical protein